MAGSYARQAAEAILTDRRGPDYYRDVQHLTDFLVHRFEATTVAASKAAQAILDDRDGAGYFADAALLAEFLEGRFGRRG